jgi:hypothetical protein
MEHTGSTMTWEREMMKVIMTSGISHSTKKTKWSRKELIQIKQPNNQSQSLNSTTTIQSRRWYCRETCSLSSKNNRTHP